MKLILASLILVATGATVAQAAPRDVAYYTANPAIRKKTIEQCLNDPGRRGQTPDCINAKAAESRAIINPKNQGMFKVRRSSDSSNR